MPLFHSFIDLAHQYWKRLLKPGDWAIDATCGNGKDTLVLAQTLQGGGLIGIDLQEIALSHTRKRLENSPINTEVHLFCQSHESFPPLASNHPIRLIVYNLGYLPGGDKSITTLTDSTLTSLESALKILMPGGCISLLCYPGHREGALETEAIYLRVSQLDSRKWNCCLHRNLLYRESPTLLLLQKSL
ncbi:MAG: class I SAM-dependent methyltransferase [Verrucomicrobia bacterium]|nr:class I SAM-dependent methyltransferase [Verrucomicrobiota bacterium]